MRSASSFNLATNSTLLRIGVTNDNSLYFGQYDDVNKLLYLTGDFSLLEVGSFGAGNFIELDTNGYAVRRGVILDNAPTTTEAINCFEPDGSGGFYIGGSFTSINGQPRYRLAHVNSSGELTSWNPSAGNDVLTICKVGDKIFVGGYFEYIAGTARDYIAIVNTAGSLQSARFTSYSYVYNMVASGDNVYVAGQFSNFDVYPNADVRRGFVCINTSGQITSWNVEATDFGSGAAIRIYGDNIYIGGSFTEINGVARNGLALVNTSGSLLSWNPSVEVSFLGFEAVQSITKIGDNVYFVGDFSSVAGTARANVAAVTTAGSLLSWYPTYNYSALSIDSYGTNIALVGYFDTVNGEPRKGLAIINTEGSLQSFDTKGPLYFAGGSEDAYHSYQNVSFYGENIVVCGRATVISKGNVASYARNSICVVDLKTGRPTSFSLNVAGGTVTNLLLNGDTLYLAGDFTSINGETRNRFAAVNTSGSLLSWNPSGGDGYVYDFLMDGDNIYMAGSFTSIGGVQRNRVALVNTAGSVLSWNPNANDAVIAIVKYNDNIYIGGSFTSVSSTTRNRLAAINADGTLLSWDPSANGSVYGISNIGDNIYIGGFFTSVASTTRNRLAAVNTAGSLLSWNPSASSSYVFEMIADGEDLYITGNFDSVNGNASPRIAVVNVDGTVTPIATKSEIAADIVVLDDAVAFLGGIDQAFPSTRNAPIMSQIILVSRTTKKVIT